MLSTLLTYFYWWKNLNLEWLNNLTTHYPDKRSDLSLITGHKCIIVFWVNGGSHISPNTQILPCKPQINNTVWGRPFHILQNQKPTNFSRISLEKEFCNHLLQFQMKRKCIFCNTSTIICKIFIYIKPFTFSEMLWAEKNNRLNRVHKFQFKHGVLKLSIIY